MKVLYVVTAYDRHPGDGITPWLVETLRRLQDRGIDVEVLAPSYRGLGSGPVDGVMVHRFRYAPRRLEDLTHDQTAPDRVRDRPGYLALLPGYLASSAAAARRLAARGRFDVVHAHWPLPHAVPGWAAASTGIPLVLTFHGVELTFARTAPVPFLTSFLRRAIRSADAVTTNSSYTAGLVQRLYDRPVEVIPFGTTVDPGSAVPAGAGARDADRELRLLFVGRLVERKGVRYLLDAIDRLPEGLAVHVDIVGDGSERQALERQARAAGLDDRVTFHGYADDSQLRRYYGAADAFVLPAVFDAKGDVEGLGVVLIEAAAFGLPLIASDAGGIPDIVKDGETGILVPPADADALAAAIRGLADDRERARRLGRGAKRHVDENFSWERIIDRLERLYLDLTTDGTD